MVEVRFAFIRQSEWGRSLALIGVDETGERVQHVFQNQEIEAFLHAHDLTLGELRGARVHLPLDSPVPRPAGSGNAGLT